MEMLQEHSLSSGRRGVFVCCLFSAVTLTLMVKATGMIRAVCTDEYSGHEFRVLIGSVFKRVDYANQFRQFEMLFLLPDDHWLRDGRSESANGLQFRASGS